MRIRWTVPAAEDLEGVKNYLEEHYPHFAKSTVRTIYNRIRNGRLQTIRTIGGSQRVLLDSVQVHRTQLETSF